LLIVKLNAKMSDFIKKNITKTKCKKKKVKAFHQKVKVFRATDPKMAVLMWGVSHSISQLSHVASPVMLLKDDFKAYSKIKIDNHFYNKENMPGHFKFKEYMPLVFRNIRERFNVDEKLFARSFFIQPKIHQQTGHSGSSKIFLTDDKLFWVKTMVREEVEVMHNIMPMYHEYIVESHTETFLPQYLAMYRTTIDTKEYYYLVLRNIFSPAKKIHKKYDLKGSQIDREAKDTDREHENTTFKDNDFTQDNVKISIGADAKSAFLGKLSKDVNFLSSLNIMDYSLLVGIHDCEKVDSSDNEEEIDAEDGFETGEDSGDGLEDTDNLQPKFLRAESNCSDSHVLAYDPEFFAIQSNHEIKREIYYLGIIDVLSYYGTTKKAAHAAKTVKHGAGAEISTVKPQLYGTRFKEFIESILE